MSSREIRIRRGDARLHLQILPADPSAAFADAFAEMFGDLLRCGFSNSLEEPKRFPTKIEPAAGATAAGSEESDAPDIDTPQN